MKNETEKKRQILTSETATRSRIIIASNQDVNVEFHPSSMLSPFCSKTRGPRWLELSRHLRHDIASYVYHVVIIGIFYTVVVVSFHLGTHMSPPKTEDSIRYVVSDIFGVLFQRNESMIARYSEICSKAKNESILLWRYNMFRFFHEMASNSSVQRSLAEVLSDLEVPFVSRFRLSYKYHLSNGSVFACESIYEGLNKSWTLPPTNSTSDLETLNLRDLAVASILSIKTYAIVPPYVMIRRVRHNLLCLAFVPTVKENEVSHEEVQDENVQAWLCPGTSLSAIVSTEVVKGIIDNSTMPTVINCTLEAAVYWEQVEIALNSFVTPKPQRFLQRAYLMMEMLSNRDSNEKLPDYVYPLVIVSAWTYSMRYMTPRHSSNAVRNAYDEIARVHPRPPSELRSKQIVSISLMILRRETHMASCEEILVNIFTALINLGIAAKKSPPILDGF